MYTKQHLREHYIQSGSLKSFQSWWKEHYTAKWDAEKQKYMYYAKINNLGDQGQVNPIAAIIQTKYHEWDLMVANQKQETEKKMNKDERTEAQQSKDYLIESLHAAIRKHDKEAYENFNLAGTRFKTIKDIRDGLKNGFFTVPEDFKDTDLVYDWYSYIKVENPAQKPNREGYDAVIKQMRLDASDVKDQIVVMGPEAGLKALNDFKAKTYH